MAVLHYYQRPGAESVPASLLRSAQAVLGGVRALHRELCYNVSWTGVSPPSPQETQLLHWLFGCPLESGDVAADSFLRPTPTDLLMEIGPRCVPGLSRGLGAPWGRERAEGSAEGALPRQTGLAPGRCWGALSCKGLIGALSPGRQGWPH
uniref:Uncharacterized protein n=1 Tax=Chelonoidis abingdonii TaxID=106734 RepID=A0A8C0GID3_CHEAB